MPRPCKFSRSLHAFVRYRRAFWQFLVCSPAWSRCYTLRNTLSSPVMDIDLAAFGIVLIFRNMSLLRPRNMNLEAGNMAKADGDIAPSDSIVCFLAAPRSFRKASKCSTFSNSGVGATMSPLSVYLRPTAVLKPPATSLDLSPPASLRSIL